VKRLPDELWFILFFVAIVLYQLLVRWRRNGTDGAARRREMEREQDRDENGAEAAVVLVPKVIMAPPPSEPWSMPAQHEGTPVPGRSELRMMPRSPPAVAMAVPKRYSKRTLFGSRKRFRQAVVAAEVLGPCRAFAPHDVRQ